MNEHYYIKLNKTFKVFKKEFFIHIVAGRDVRENDRPIELPSQVEKNNKKFIISIYCFFSVLLTFLLLSLTNIEAIFLKMFL